MGSGGRAVERRTVVNRGDSGSILPNAVSKVRQIRSPRILAIDFVSWRAKMERLWCCKIDYVFKYGGSCIDFYIPVDSEGGYTYGYI